MAHYNHVKTIILSTVQPNLNHDAISLEPSSTSIDDCLKDGWEIVSVFPCVFTNTAAVVAVLGKN